MNEVLKDKINNLKNEIDAMRPLDKDTEGRIQQKFRLDWNFHSNNIEGNSLTFGETKTFLLHGITADGKPLKDHLDIKGHNQAIQMLEDIVHDGRDLSENFIREMHEIILHEPYDKPAITTEGKKVSRRIQVGSYKTQPNHVITKTGETFYFAKPEETPALMNDLMAWFNGAITERKLHPIELAALLHYKFIRIHPFDDGNGRLSRILMNLTLMKFGFPPVIIKTQKKDEYYRALQQADGGDNTFFVDYIAQLQIDSLELYIRGAKGEHIEDQDDIDKEIALFKASLNRKNASLTRSIETQLNILQKSIIPLLENISKKTHAFNDLFHSFCNEYIDDTVQNSEYINYTGKFFSETNNLIDYLKNAFESNTNTDWFDVGFLWNGFDKNGVATFDVVKTIKIRLNNFRYYITYNHINIEKYFDENLSDSEIKFIAKQFAQDILSEIKNRAEENKS